MTIASLYCQENLATPQGNSRLQACAYRHGRVIVVSVYCTIREPRAFRIDVYSPTRGLVSIYTEAKVPVSTVRRRDHFSFNAEVQPPPRPEAGLPPLALTMSFSELQRYDRRRAERFLPACYGGVEIHRPRGGCLGDLAPRAAQWAERNRAFLAQPPADWYHIARELRALARKHGKTPGRMDSPRRSAVPHGFIGQFSSRRRVQPLVRLAQ